MGFSFQPIIFEQTVAAEDIYSALLPYAISYL